MVVSLVVVVVGGAPVVVVSIAVEVVDGSVVEVVSASALVHAAASSATTTNVARRRVSLHIRGRMAGLPGQVNTLDLGEKSKEPACLDRRLHPNIPGGNP